MDAMADDPCRCAECSGRSDQRRISMAQEAQDERDAAHIAQEFVAWAVENGTWRLGDGNGGWIFMQMQAAAQELLPRQAEPVRSSTRRALSARKSLAVFARDNYMCLRCGTREGLTVDHIKPVSKGGTNDVENLQTLCGSCNSRKGVRE